MQLSAGIRDGENPPACPSSSISHSCHRLLSAPRAPIFPGGPKCHYQLEIPRNNPVAISPLPPKFAAEWGKGRISALASPLLAPAALGSLGCFCSSAFQVKLSEDKTRTGENREGGKAHQHSSLVAQVRLTGGN